MNINYEEVKADVREWLEASYVYNDQCGICSQISTKVTNTLNNCKLTPLVRMSSELLTAKFPPYTGDISYPISGHIEYFHHGNNKTLWQGEQLALRNQMIEVLKSSDLLIELDDEYLYLRFMPKSE